MKSRREVLRDGLHGGLGLFAVSALSPIAGSASAMGLAQNMGRCGDGVQRAKPMGLSGLSAQELKASRPLAARQIDPNPRFINGYQFKPWFEGDDFRDEIPFHTQQNTFPGGQPPAPAEEVEVAVIGGGLSGLTSAYMLREYNPVVFELHAYFGGNAQGGTINGEQYSLGSAYFITPDPGTDLYKLYQELGLMDAVRVDGIPAPVEIEGELHEDIWTGFGVEPKDIPAYEAYRGLVNEMAKNYPDVPFPEQWMIELDQLSLREHIEQRVMDEAGVPVPAALAAAIQAYCYSSFAAGWEEISATLGWNFLAAEEFGRWVLPGGNAYIADQLWRRLQMMDRVNPKNAPHLRPSRRVVDLRVQKDGRSLISWIEPSGEYRSLLAREVVMACPKNIARHMIPNLEAEEPERYNAMRLTRRAYMVATIVLDCPVPDGFYDIFLLDQPEEFPMSEGEATNFWRYTDVTNGSFAQGHGPGELPRESGVLTLYWPLPFESARFTIALGDPIGTYGEALTARLEHTLDLVGLSKAHVQEIRFARWGHALPLARVGFLADGIPALLMDPYRESVHWVNQDNWALPAIENSMLDAIHVSRVIRQRLG